MYGLSEFKTPKISTFQLVETSQLYLPNDDILSRSQNVKYFILVVSVQVLFHDNVMLIGNKR